MSPSAAPVLSVAGASLVRGGAQVLHHISFTIHAGDHTAILGPNGSGKSSLIRLLTLADHPVAAVAHPDPVRWFGRARIERTALMRRIGVVSADLDAGFAKSSAGGRVRVIDAVVSGLLGTEGLFSHQTVTAADRARAEQAVEAAGLSHLAGRLLPSLSVGERRRTLIARAMVASPELLLLDEPTTGLDLGARHDLLEAVRAACRAGTTLLLVTHHLEEIVPEIARVLLLRDGQLIADGARDVVLTGPQLSRAFGREVEVLHFPGHSQAHVVTRSSAAPKPDVPL
ncbi:MAG: ABC transporter ATP-binding protein [Vicinamibacterales bacterium]